jgi:hypothetical protein
MAAAQEAGSPTGAHHPDKFVVAESAQPASPGVGGKPGQHRPWGQAVGHTAGREPAAVAARPVPAAGLQHLPASRLRALNRWILRILSIQDHL